MRWMAVSLVALSVALATVSPARELSACATRPMPAPAPIPRDHPPLSSSPTASEAASSHPWNTAATPMCRTAGCWRCRAGSAR